MTGLEQLLEMLRRRQAAMQAQLEDFNNRRLQWIQEQQQYAAQRSRPTDEDAWNAAKGRISGFLGTDIQPHLNQAAQWRDNLKSNIGGFAEDLNRRRQQWVQEQNAPKHTNIRNY